MNYYYQLLEAQYRRNDAQRERNRLALIDEARKGESASPRLKRWFSFRLALPRRRQQPECTSQREFA